MSNDITHLPGVPGIEKLQEALILRGKVASLIENSQPLRDTRRPERPPSPRRLSQLTFDPERMLLT